MLRNPPAGSPLYQQTFHRRDPHIAPTDNSFASALFFYLFVGSGGIAAPLVLFWLIGVYYGAVWLRRIVRETRPLSLAPASLLDATPHTRIGLFVTVTLGVLHRRHRFENLLSAPLLILRVLISFLMFIVILIMLPTTHQPRSTLDFFMAAITSVLFFTILVQLVQRYAILSSALLSMLSGTFRLLLPYLQSVALTIYLTLNIVLLLLLVLIARSVWFIGATVGSYFIPTMLLGQIVCGFCVSEGFVYLMWVMLKYRLGKPLTDNVFVPS